MAMSSLPPGLDLESASQNRRRRRTQNAAEKNGNLQDEVSKLAEITDDLRSTCKEMVTRLDMLERVYVFLDFDEVQAILEKCEVSALHVDTICTQPEMEMSPGHARAEVGKQVHSSPFRAPPQLPELPEVDMSAADALLQRCLSFDMESDSDKEEVATQFIKTTMELDARQQNPHRGPYCKSLLPSHICNKECFTEFRCLAGHILKLNGIRNSAGTCFNCDADVEGQLEACYTCPCGTRVLCTSCREDS